MQKPVAVLVGISALLLSLVMGITQCASAAPVAPVAPPQTPDSSMLSRMMPAMPMQISDAGVVDAGVVMADAGVLAPQLKLPSYNPASKSGMALPMPLPPMAGSSQSGGSGGSEGSGNRKP